MPKLPEREIIIDGLNVIHAWDGGRAALRKGLSAATAWLCERLNPLVDNGHWSVLLVLDGGGAEVARDPVASMSGFEVLTAPASVTADAVIEWRAARRSGRGETIVVSADRLLGESAAASGATVLSPRSLQSWAEDARSGRDRRMSRGNAGDLKQGLPL
jgi:predicted RNA-binding protein with PIN domain